MNSGNPGYYLIFVRYLWTSSQVNISPSSLKLEELCNDSSKLWTNTLGASPIALAKRPTLAEPNEVKQCHAHANFCKLPSQALTQSINEHLEAGILSFLFFHVDQRQIRAPIWVCRNRTGFQQPSLFSAFLAQSGSSQQWSMTLNVQQGVSIKKATPQPNNSEHL